MVEDFWLIREEHAKMVTYTYREEISKVSFPKSERYIWHM